MEKKKKCTTPAITKPLFHRIKHADHLHPPQRITRSPTCTQGPGPAPRQQAEYPKREQNSHDLSRERRQKGFISLKSSLYGQTHTVIQSTTALPRRPTRPRDADDAVTGNAHLLIQDLAQRETLRSHVSGAHVRLISEFTCIGFKMWHVSNLHYCYESYVRCVLENPIYTTFEDPVQRQHHSIHVFN